VHREEVHESRELFLDLLEIAVLFEGHVEQSAGVARRGGFGGHSVNVSVVRAEK
jgi:hypothetical protein